MELVRSKVRLCKDCVFYDASTQECHHPQAVASCDLVTGDMPMARTMRLTQGFNATGTTARPTCGVMGEWFERRA